MNFESLGKFIRYWTPDGDSGGAGGGGTGSDAGNHDNVKTGGSPNTGDKSQSGGAVKTFTQEDVDRIIEQRLERERSKHAQELERAKMDELERTKAEKEAADKARQEAETARDQALISSEIRVAALVAGVKPERLPYFIKLVNSEGISVKDGVVDSKALNSAVEAVLRDMPEFVGKPGESKGGSDMGSQGGGSDDELTEEKIAQMSNAELKANLAKVQAFYANRRK